MNEELITVLQDASKEWKRSRFLDESVALVEFKDATPPSPNVKVHFGPILSGSKLVDDFDFHQGLVNSFPGYKPLGGEMEASGISDSMTLSTQAPFVIIKGVCDWGMSKSQHTKKLQPAPAAAAMDF